MITLDIPNEPEVEEGQIDTTGQTNMQGTITTDTNLDDTRFSETIAPSA